MVMAYLEQPDPQIIKDGEDWPGGQGLAGWAAAGSGVWRGRGSWGDLADGDAPGQVARGGQVRGARGAARRADGGGADGAAERHGRRQVLPGEQPGDHAGVEAVPRAGGVGDRDRRRLGQVAAGAVGAQRTT